MYTLHGCLYLCNLIHVGAHCTCTEHACMYTVCMSMEVPLKCAVIVSLRETVYIKQSLFHQFGLIVSLFQLVILYSCAL